MSNSKITSPTLKKFFSLGIQKTFKTGQVIIELSKSSAEVFYIEEGFVKASSISSRGESKLYAIYKAGEIFPLASALKDSQRDLKFEALDETTLFQISKQKFRQFLDSHPQVLTEVIDRLVNLVDIYIGRVDNLEIVNAYQRIVARLLFFSWRFGEQNDNKIVIRTPLTHTVIANSLGMSRETVTRGLKKLEQKKLIGFEDRHIVIPNKSALEQELESFEVSELANSNFKPKYLALILVLFPFITDLLNYFNIA